MAVRAHRRGGMRPRRVRRAGRVRRFPGGLPRLPGQARCKGTVVKCNVPLRGWTDGMGGCPNVGGICMACTMPGFPDRFMPFMEPTPLGQAKARAQQFTYGPLLRRMRRRAIRREFDREPAWRGPGQELRTGYGPRW